jgi:hypothetical protein
VPDQLYCVNVKRNGLLTLLHCSADSMLLVTHNDPLQSDGYGDPSYISNEGTEAVMFKGISVSDCLRLRASKMQAPSQQTHLRTGANDGVTGRRICAVQKKI